MRKKIIILICTLTVLTRLNAQVPTIVTDPTVNVSVITEWLASLDQLYQMYDETMNQIEMIQQNYEQLQYYVDRAASFDFENIEWDGDLDFRDEIKSATKQVNKQLTNIRKIRNTLTAKTINIGGESFSFASLCGVEDGNGNISELVSAASNYYSDGFKKAAQVWAEGVEEDDAERLWHRYGLSPANYRMVREVENKLDEKVSYLIGQADEDMEEMDEGNKELYQTIDNIMSMLDQEDITEPELAQVQAMLQQQTILALKDLEEQLKQGIAYTVWKDRLEKQEAEAKEQSEKERIMKEEKRTLPDYF